MTFPPLQGLGEQQKISPSPLSSNPTGQAYLTPHQGLMMPEAQVHLAQVLQDALPLADAQPAAEADIGELALDLTQIGLDIVGMIEPTPFADLTNAAISGVRGDLLGVGLSIAGVLPYIGDAAKLGKLGSYAQTVSKAIDLALSNSAARKLLEPALRSINDAINAVPQGVLNALPDGARQSIETMKSKLDDFFARGADNVDVFANSNYTRAEYDDYVARKTAAGETPRTPEDYVAARDHWVRGSAAHREAVEGAMEDLRLQFPDAEIIETPSLRTADGDLSYPDIMVIDEDAGTLTFVEVKTGGADLTPNQRALAGDLENATFTPTQADKMGVLTPDSTLGELYPGGIRWDEIRGPGYKD